MKEEFKEIKFDKSTSDFQFDVVSLQDLLKKKPKDHSQFEFHKISFYVIFLVTHNSGTYNLNFKDHTLKKGTLFTLRKDNIHKFYKSKAKGILLVFTENFIVNHASAVDVSKIFLLFNEMIATPKLQLNDSELKEIMSFIGLIKDEYIGTKDNFSSNIIRNLIQVIITRLMRIKSKSNHVFEDNKYLTLFLEFQALIETEGFSNKKVSYFANKMGVSNKTLNNVTQSIIRKSAKALINDIIIIQSKRLIINSADSLSTISYQMGFDEPTNFFKYFKKYTGLSPKQFRETHQNNS